ncbi:MAG TPA: efflux RND transporter periplasmic adaptor subunit [Pseudomonadota bacterium]|nr:efflux RND transporter periplasmic adaptor subunit [Pseudomonadota bacterium]
MGALAIASLGIMWKLGPKVTAVGVSRRQIVRTIVVSGRVLPPARINVGSMVPGVVATVAVKEGEHVHAGQLLVQLGDAEAQAAVAMARAGLQQARARLRQVKHIAMPLARESHRQADANLELAHLNYERLLVLVKQGSTPTAQLDEAKRALQVAQSQHAAAETQARGSGPRGVEHALALAGYAQAAASLAQAEARAAESRITASVSAVVLTRSVEPGDLVQPGRTLLVLARDGQTQLSVQPDEKNLAELRLGQSARASADAFPKEHFLAQVSYIAPSIDPQRGTVEVRFLVENPPAYLRPDMTVSVNIEVGSRAAALVVPKEAVRDLASATPWVYVLRGRRIAKQRIEVGLRDESFVEIEKGLVDGEQVILQNRTTLRDGQWVRAQLATGG